MRLLLLLTIGLLYTACTKDELCPTVDSITGNEEFIYAFTLSDGTHVLNPDGYYRVGDTYCGPTREIPTR